jgi:hypothetical protein
LTKVLPLTVNAARSVSAVSFMTSSNTWDSRRVPEP